MRAHRFKAQQGWRRWLVTVGLLMSAGVQAQVGSTPEADFSSTYATELVAKAGELKTPVAIYEYLRNNTEYIPYWGSRSGSVNTFMGLRGNDVDLASTLIAMLRSQGTPARYATGVIRVPSAQMLNWADDTSEASAGYTLLNAGRYDIKLNTAGAYAGTFEFTHVWVQALVPYGQYRGATLDASGASAIDCRTAPTQCTWVDLDVSYKQRQYKRLGLNPASAAVWGDTQINAYFDAIKNNDAYRRDKNPVTILEQDVLAWRDANAGYAGKSLEDVVDTGTIIPAREGLLPASLPYLLAGAVTTYDSVALHDAAQTIKWDTKLKVTVQACDPSYNPHSTDTASFSLSALATGRLALVYTPGPNNTVNLELRKGRGASSTVEKTWNFGTVTCDTGSKTMTKGSTFYLLLQGDVPPNFAANEPYRYEETVGERIVIASGGESSNWSQVHRAASSLLANSNTSIVYSASKPLPGQTCVVADGSGCIPYVDNGNGVWDAADVPLADSAAGAEMTLGLLEVAGAQYLADFRDKYKRADGLMRIHTPIRSLVGIVKSNYEVQYLADTTAFAIQPNGLVVDFRGGELSLPTVRGSSPALFSIDYMYFMNMVSSSLEHEVWQAVTGLDAVSTVRTIQMARAAGSELKSYKKNATVNDRDRALTDLGFASTPPSPWTTAIYDLYGTRPTVFLAPNWDGTKSFVFFKRAPTDIADTDILFNANYDGNSAQLLQIFNTCATSLNSNPPTAPWQWRAPQGKLWFGRDDPLPPPCFLTYQPPAGSPSPGNYVDVAQVRTDFRDGVYLDWANGDGKPLLDFIDANKGFKVSDYVFRDDNLSVTQYSTQAVFAVARTLHWESAANVVMTKESVDLGAAKAEAYITAITYADDDFSFTFSINLFAK
jgi:hypothetical protein